MYTVTVLFRLTESNVAVAIGGTDPDIGKPVWFTPEPIVGNHIFHEWEELVRPHVLRFAERLGVNPATLHGGRLAYSGSVHSMMEFDFDSPDWADHESVPAQVENYYASDAN